MTMINKWCLVRITNMRGRTDESENACASLVLSKWGQILPANEKVSWFSIKMPQRAGQELVFNQNASKSRTRVDFQSKCPKEQDVRRSVR